MPGLGMLDFKSVFLIPISAPPRDVRGGCFGRLCFSLVFLSEAICTAQDAQYSEACFDFHLRLRLHARAIQPSDMRLYESRHNRFRALLPPFTPVGLADRVLWVWRSRLWNDWHCCFLRTLLEHSINSCELVTSELSVCRQMNHQGRSFFARKVVDVRVSRFPPVRAPKMPSSG